MEASLSSNFILKHGDTLFEVLQHHKGVSEYIRVLVPNL